MKDTVPHIPADAPKGGERFRHYKGDLYEVVAIALHSNDEEWMVVYKPLYINSVATHFTRPLREWREKVEWKGSYPERFSSI